MNPERLLKNFDGLIDTPDAVPRLRRFILDLAVRGKLVEQNPEDEPAGELLKRIEAEKKRLEKKEKTLPKIKEDEVPFSLFDNLVLVRLGEIAAVEKGITGIQKASPGPYPLVSLASERSTSAEYQFNAAAAIVPLISSTGHGHASIKRLHYQEGKFALGNILCAVVPYCPELVSARYLYEYLTAYKDDLLVSKMLGTANVSLTISKIAEVPVPFITSKSQQRLDELMKLCDELEATQAKRERRRDRLVAATLHRLNNGKADGESGDSFSFDDSAHFYCNYLPRLTTRPDHINQLRQTIINLAVRGKLVLQDPKDEPADKLITQIQTERARLMRGKKEHQLSPIDKAKVPFTLPVGWAWARFPELGIFGRGKSKHRPRNDSSLFEGGTHLVIQTGDVARSNGVVKTYTSKYNELGLSQSAKWPKGTLCITIAANIADSGILSFDACFPDSVVGFIPAALFPNARYFEYFIRTAKSTLLEFAPATAQKNINLGILNEVLIPLPPLAEQNRIVAKVDELMVLCHELEAGITSNTTTSRKLFEATLQEVLCGAI